MFVRTASGFNNEASFRNVDYIVYCEGDADSECTNDEMFWSEVFARSGKKVKCKSFGPKTSLTGLASHIIANDISNNIVAMDRDYDDIYGGIIDDKRVIYTYGYSWESDVMMNMDVYRCTSPFFAVSDKYQLKLDYESYINNLYYCNNRITILDIAYIKSPIKLFDREKPLSIISISGDVPKFKRGKILSSAQRIDRGNCEFVLPSDDEPSLWQRRFHGKSVARLIYRWIVSCSSEDRKSSSVPYDAFMRIAISNFEINGGVGQMKAHYDESLARLAA